MRKTVNFLVSWSMLHRSTHSSTKAQTKKEGTYDE
jgi:hypothetical protein